MRQHAVFIGIDHSFAPLESCVNDATAMRDLLVSLGVFAGGECTPPTSPAPAGEKTPSRKVILDLLLDLMTCRSRSTGFWSSMPGMGSQPGSDGNGRVALGPGSGRRDAAQEFGGRTDRSRRTRRPLQAPRRQGAVLDHGCLPQ